MLMNYQNVENHHNSDKDNGNTIRLMTNEQ